MLRLHKWKLILLGLSANFILLINLASGQLKPHEILNWLDVFSEWGAALLVLVWLLLILQSRPSGRVTQFLSLGLSGIFLASFQDGLDEFIKLPDTIAWDHWIESGFMPLGLMLLTVGIYHWHKEQLIISRQMRKRERLFRDHKAMDFTTPLSDATYLRKQLAQALASHRAQSEPLAFLLIDINDFSGINRRYGSIEADRLLAALSELLLLNIRHKDLLCRYAGDRFALLLPNTNKLSAEGIVHELNNAVRNFAFKTQAQGESLFHSVSIGLALAQNDNPESLLVRANSALLLAKETSQHNIHLAA